MVLFKSFNNRIEKIIEIHKSSHLTTNVLAVFLVFVHFFSETNRKQMYQLNPHIQMRLR